MLVLSLKSKLHPYMWSYATFGILKKKWFMEYEMWSVPSSPMIVDTNEVLKKKAHLDSSLFCLHCLFSVLLSICLFSKLCFCFKQMIFSGCTSFLQRKTSLRIRWAGLAAFTCVCFCVREECLAKCNQLSVTALSPVHSLRLPLLYF